MKETSAEKKARKEREKEEARAKQIDNIINYNRVVAIELANRAKEKKPNKDAFICLQKVNKIYDNLVQAVFDFSLDIKKNEFIVLVGPSGCGKSTTLRMIAGLEEITAGNLFIDKVYANVLPPKDRDISMVFQSYALYPHMSVYDNMAFAMQIRPYLIPQVDKDGNPVMGIDKTVCDKLTKQIETLDKQISNMECYGFKGSTVKEIEVLKDQKADLEAQLNEASSKQVQVKTLRKYNKEEINEFVDEAAKILQIQDYLDRKPRELSGGQRQRVALGRAIVKKAKLFLMDEPLSNLDAKLRVSMRSEIKRIHKSIGATTIYVTHDQTEAMTMADRIVIMNKGYIQQIGKPTEIYNKPANAFVATFIGSPAMNIYDAKFANGSVELADGFKLKIKPEFNSIIEKSIKAKIADIDNFITNGLEEERQKQLLVNKETIILDMKNKDYKAVAGVTDPLDELKLTEEEEAICLDRFNKATAGLNDKKEKYTSMINSGVYDVKFGIRPEDIYLEGSSMEKTVEPSEVKPLKVSILELLGNEYFIHGELGKKDFIVKTNTSHPVNEGDDISIQFDLNKVHIFDAIDDKIIY